MTRRMLIAGVGNIFLGDDGFGGEVARRLAGAGLPGWVRVSDYGTSGMHLAYDMADGYDTTIMIDTTRRGGEPGTLYVIEPDRAARRGPGAGRASQAPPPAGWVFDAHGMQPDVVFDLVKALGAKLGRVLVVGCEPASVGHGIGLSAPVAAAVDEAVRIVTRIVRDEAGAGRPTGQGDGEGKWSHVPRHTR